MDVTVLSLYAKGLTTGEISAHFAQIYGASVSKETISRITDMVLEEMAAWCARPLDPVYAAVFIDAIVVKVKDRQVANRPVYAAIGVTLAGESAPLLFPDNGSMCRVVALAKLKPSLQKITRLLKELSPEETEVEFGLKFGGETGVIVAKGTAEMNFTVRMTWKETLMAKEQRAPSCCCSVSQR